MCEPGAPGFIGGAVPLNLAVRVIPSLVCSPCRLAPDLTLILTLLSVLVMPPRSLTCLAGRSLLRQTRVTTQCQIAGIQPGLRPENALTKRSSCDLELAPHTHDGNTHLRNCVGR